jgi:hypothetical protein
VTEEWLRAATRPVRLTKIDPTVPNVARVWNYLVGGRDNFAADRNAARQLLAVAPVMEAIPPASRAFLRRAVGYLAAEAGIRQFLDIGTGMPTAGNTHEIAQAVAPESRIVLVDNDPVVLVHARALLRSTPEGVTSYIDADIRDPGKIIAAARESLDFDQPVALMLIGTLTYVEGAGEITAIIRTLLDALPPGSYLALTQPASDLDEAANEAQRWWNNNVPTPVWMRDRATVTSWLDGLDLIEPGVVEVHRWRPDGRDPEYDGVLPLYGAVGRKP